MSSSMVLETTLLDDSGGLEKDGGGGWRDGGASFPSLLDTGANGEPELPNIGKYPEVDYES